MGDALIIKVEGEVTKYSSSAAVDRYALELTRRGRGGLRRNEEFTFKRLRGPGRRITVSGTTVNIANVNASADVRGKQLQLADEQTTGLSTLPRLAPTQGGEGIEEFAQFVSSIRVLEADVQAARLPNRVYGAQLAEDASNLADALLRMKENFRQSFADLERDLARCLPGFQQLVFAPVGGSTRSVVIQLKEQGLAEPVDLADASFGTVRLLALLVALYEPDPPPFTAIEEIDHGLHPYALDVLVDALRAASARTQILVATHSPTFVNRLSPDELVICDRNAETGASLIPAVDAATIARTADATELRLGELWFSGALGGVPA